MYTKKSGRISFKSNRRPTYRRGSNSYSYGKPRNKGKYQLRKALSIKKKRSAAPKLTVTASIPAIPFIPSIKL